MDAIVVKNLRKSFGPVTAVDSVNLIIPKGSIYGFIGPNGAGKTTTIRMITGVLTPDEGTVHVLGMDVRHHSFEVKKKMGVIPENGTIYSDLTAEQNLILTAKFYRMDPVCRKSRAEELLHELGLIERKNDLVRNFSKGMRQRVSVACAIMHSPDVLILDEPTTGLDVHSRRLVLNTVRNLNQKGSTILITTHNLEEANELCSHISIINKGRIVASGSPELLKNQNTALKYIEISFLEQISDKIFTDPLTQKVELRGDKWRIYTDNTDKTCKYLLHLAERESLNFVSFATSSPNLEEAFIRFTEGAENVTD